MRSCPVISLGWGRPMIWRMEGATSARMPLSVLAALLSVTYTKGTGVREWAVLGVPSAFSAWSALPWSAMMITS